MRTTGGYRLYGPEEAHRAHRMRTHIARGLAAAESARLVLSERLDRADRAALDEAWRALDALGAARALDGLLAGAEPEATVVHDLLPLLRALPPERRHFAARMLEGRLLRLAEHWHDAPGPLALLACGPGEHDTVPLIVLGLALHRQGHRIVYLGADVPVDALGSVAAALAPETVVVSFADAEAAARFAPGFGATVVCGNHLAAARALGA